MARDDGRRAPHYPDCPTCGHAIRATSSGKRCGMDCPENARRALPQAPRPAPYEFRDILDEQHDDRRERIGAMLTPAQAPRPAPIDPFLSQQPDAARLSPAETQRQHLDTFTAPRITPGQAAGFTQAPSAWRPQLTEMHRRALLVGIEQQIKAYTLPIVLEALADALTIAAREHETDATGPYAALAATIEEARAYAQAHNL